MTRLNVKKNIWSRQTFIVYCFSLMSIHGVKVVTTTNIVLPHTSFLLVNAVLVISWLWSNVSGVVYWFSSTKKADSLQQINQNRLISIILSSLCVYGLVNTVVDFINVFVLSPPIGVNVTQLRVIVLQDLPQRSSSCM